MDSWVPTFLLLLWLQTCISGPSVESAYKKVKHREGDTLSVHCSYKGRRSRVDGKVWCKVRRKKCEPGFLRSWAKGPRYLLRDDAQAKVVHITMAALTRQDSGKYWCMRNTSGSLYPMMGFMLDVSPGTTRPTPVTRLSFPGTSATAAATEPRRTTGLQPVTESPSDARAFSAGPSITSTKSGWLGSSSSTTGMCHQLTPNRSQESYLTGLMAVLTFLPAPVVLAAAYGFWKKRHMGSYSVDRDSAKPWIHPPEGPELLWKPAWFKTM